MTEPQKLPILSLKGGTGKTTTCLGLAEILRDAGKRVGLLDVNVHAFVLPRAIGIEAYPGYDSLMRGKLRPITHNGYQVLSVGLLYPEEDPACGRGRPAYRDHEHSLDDDLEWIVVDAPPTAGDEVQALLENLPSIYGCVVVCQPNALAVLAIAKTLILLQETGTPIAGALTNMAGYECSYCHRVSNPS